MKTILFSLMMISSSVFADDFKCNIPKTTLRLYQAQSTAKKILDCKLPTCIVKRIVKAETQLCKSMKACPSLSEALENPCLPNNRLTEKAKEDFADGVEKVVKVIIDRSIDIVEGQKNGKSVTCKTDGVQDAQFVATFQKINSKEPKVSLFIPSGETSGKTAKGECKRIAGADEFAIRCSVSTNERGYMVELMSDGSPRMFSRVYEAAETPALLETLQDCK